MARIQVWTDDSVRRFRTRRAGEIVIHDPQISGHRKLVVVEFRKICRNTTRPAIGVLAHERRFKVKPVTAIDRHDRRVA